MRVLKEKTIHVVKIALVLLAGACAAQSAQSNRVPDRVLATTDQEILRSAREPVTSLEVDASPDALFQVLPAVYSDLGIEVKTLDPANRIVGNTRFQKMYRLAGQSMDTYVGCGLTATGPVANGDRVTLSLISRVIPAGSTSMLETKVSGYAQDLSLNSGQISCISTGRLEERIRSLAIARLNKPNG